MCDWCHVICILFVLNPQLLYCQPTVKSIGVRGHSSSGEGDTLVRDAMGSDGHTQKALVVNRVTLVHVVAMLVAVTSAPHIVTVHMTASKAHLATYIAWA